MVEFENIKPQFILTTPTFINDGNAWHFLNAGTSEGAKKGWDTRRGGAKADNFEDAKQDAVAATKAADEKEAEVPKHRQTRDDHFVMAEHHRVAADLHAHAARQAAEEERGDDSKAHAQAAMMHQSMEHAHAKLALGDKEYQRQAGQRQAQDKPDAGSPPKYDSKSTPRAGDKEPAKAGSKPDQTLKPDSNAKSSVDKPFWQRPVSKGQRPGFGRGMGMGRMPTGGGGRSKQEPAKAKKKARK